MCRCDSSARVALKGDEDYLNKINTLPISTMVVVAVFRISDASKLVFQLVYTNTYVSSGLYSAKVMSIDVAV